MHCRYYYGQWYPSVCIGLSFLSYDSLSYSEQPGKDMQVELPRHTPVEDRIYLILNVESRKFLDPYLVLADIEFRSGLLDPSRWRWTILIPRDTEACTETQMSNEKMQGSRRENDSNHSC